MRTENIFAASGVFRAATKDEKRQLNKLVTGAEQKLAKTRRQLEEKQYTREQIKELDLQDASYWLAVLCAEILVKDEVGLPIEHFIADNQLDLLLDSRRQQALAEALDFLTPFLVHADATPTPTAND